MDELKQAAPLEVHRKTDFPSMATPLLGVFNEVLSLRARRRQQVRKAARVRRHLDAVILDLWVAANYSESPFRFVSRNETHYRKETRYRKLYFKYDLLMGVLDDLVELGYIEQKKGYRDRETGVGYQTRIKATDQLLQTLNQFDIKEIVREPEVPEGETIIKRDSSGKLIDYEDDRFTIADREFMQNINNNIRNRNIGTDAVDLRHKHDPTSITLRMIFKEESGGRMYGAFWQTMKKGDRRKLLLDNSPVVELDYSALHPTIAYAQCGLPVTEDPYLIDGFERGDVKIGVLMMLNCITRRKAINAIRRKGVGNIAALVAAIENKHSAIVGYFYTPGFGLHLQNTDSWIAQTIMKRLMDVGIVCLPIHDSFVVAKEHEAVLHRTMVEVFYEKVLQVPIIH